MIGMLSTAVAVMFIGTGALLDYKDCSPTRELPELKLTNVLSALGTFLFTYGGHHAFPTIQHDMRKPAEFHKTTFLAFISRFFLGIFS